MQDNKKFEDRLNDALKRNDIDLTGDVPVKGAEDESGFAEASTGLAYGMRIGLEFMSGTVVGLGIGWGLDRFFDTSPWCLLVFTVLGFFAGILNVFRDINRLDNTIGVNRKNVVGKKSPESKG
jgi:ATP synthase protein I